MIARDRGAGRGSAELRRVTAIFVDLPDLVDGTDPDAVQELIVALQADFERHGAQLNQTRRRQPRARRLVAATGLPPHAHADDPERGVRTALAVAADAAPARLARDARRRQRAARCAG